MASKRGGSRVKPYSLTVKTYTASGKLSRKNIRLSSSKPYILPQENSPRDNEALSNNSAEFETNDILDDRESMDEDHEEEQDIRSRYVRRIKEGECWKSVQDELVKTYIEIQLCYQTKSNQLKLKPPPLCMGWRIFKWSFQYTPPPPL